MTAEPLVTFRHQALLYDDFDDLLATAVPFIQEGVDDGDAVVVQASEATWTGISARLSSPEAVMFDPLGNRYRHPQQALWGLRQLFDEERTGSGRIRAFGEIGFNEDGLDAVEWGRAESALNHVLRNHGLWALCPYNRATLPAIALEGALRTHPDVIDADGARNNDSYEQTRDYLRGVDSLRAVDPLEAEVPFAALDLVTLTDLAAARIQLETALAATRLTTERKADFTSAVFEVVVNALLHGGDAATVKIWATGDHILCRVRDTGPGLPDPLTGYEPPTPDAVTSGIGLWTARQLTDQMTTTYEPEGFTVRLSVSA
ncbi:MAG: anti-sigma factor RsbA family regulatory protein [Nocardioidaceae bacterium]